MPGQIPTKPNRQTRKYYNHLVVLSGSEIRTYILTIVVHAEAHDHQVALYAVQYGDAREIAPARKSILFHESQARFIVAKNETKKGGHSDGGCVRNGTTHQLTPEAASLIFRCEVNAQFAGTIIGRTPVKGRIAYPAKNLPLFKGNPQWPPLGRMLLKPSATAFDRYRFRIRSDHAGWDSFVVDADDCRKVVQSRVSDFHNRLIIVNLR